MTIFIFASRHFWKEICCSLVPWLGFFWYLK